jgi:integral membrane protein
MRAFTNRYLRFKPFTDDEAWLLFKLAAFGEAIGWSILISGLLIKHFLTPMSNIPVLLAGQIHGILFLTYIAAAFILSPSLKWSPRQAIGAALCSVPPYGSLVFELWAAHRRKMARLKSLRGSLVSLKLSDETLAS